MSAAGDITSKLERLRRNSQRLEMHRNLSLEKFLDNPAVQDDTCYLLFTTCEGALEIGAELLMAVGQPKPRGVADVFALLAEEEVLSETCVSQFTAMQGLCDALSQQYAEIDPQWVYQTLQVNLIGLNQFAEQVRAFLDR
jgi:uncharacterized protein YutE (UPF0331/DUF86 family)